MTLEKTTIYGLPINPMRKIEQLAGRSFCVSYGTRDKLGPQLDDAIRLVGEDQILLVDNGAFSMHKKGIKAFDLAYLEDYESWAAEILARCPQAIAVIPDVIDGTEEQNAELIRETQLDTDRAMPIWHLNESIAQLLWMCESFGYVGFGSSGEFFKIGTAKWHARMTEALMAIDAWEKASEGAHVRPRIHLMRAQSLAHLFEIDSTDSVNVAMNHNRQLKVAGENVAQFAARVDAKIQKSAGPAAEHQIKRPLLDHVEQKNWEALKLLEAAGYNVTTTEAPELQIAA